MDADAPAAALPRETADSEPSFARVSEVGDALREAGIADVRTAAVERAAYSSDGSLFRVVPAAVVFPRTAAEVGDVLSVARRLGVPVTSRGAGTTLAGNAIGPGIVLDFSVHMNRILGIDAEQRAAWVEPGAVHAQLQAAVKPYGLRFGPDPSTHSRCTIGGMIGNNACGPRAMGYGRTVDNILALRVMLIDGSVVTLTGDDGDVFPRLQELVNNHLGLIRTQLGTFSRQVSGYGLEHLLPENGCDARRAFAGSEGTWGVVLAAKMQLVADPEHVTAVVLGYADMPTAADDVPVLSQFPVTACEGMDRRMVDRLIEEKGPDAVPLMPAGGGWMLVELAGDDPAALERQAAELINASHADDAMVLPGEESGPIWKIRADGAGLVSRTPDGRDCHAGWEDSAVPPEKLGDYLRDLMSLLEEHGLWALPYGHFGDGCLHMRVDFPLAGDGGRQVMRDFMFAAAELVAAYGGSVSGEHGDGRARGELLASMYSPEAIRLFAAVKHLFDPRGLLNPGIIVDPDPLDERIRLASIRPGDMPPARRQLGFSFASDSGDFATAVHRCTGVGKCRADAAASGAVMCPSYQATKDEKHSTRGRARVLQEMVDGRLVDGGWQSPEVHEALDLCLSCKACGSECPTGTDMATYKAEVLYQSYRGRLRPMDHYVLGWLPKLARLATPVAGLANLPQRLPLLGRWAKRAANIDVRRQIPTFTSLPFTRWFAQRAGDDRTLPGHRRQPAPTPASGQQVVLFADTWSNFFAPRVLAAAVEVLRSTGVDVRVIPSTECCGLTWISTGQLDTARASLTSAITALDATAATASGTDADPAGGPIIVVEPSCAATLREDAARLLGTEAATRVAGRVRTLAEFLLDSGAELPDLTGISAVVQPHCHHSAVMGFTADRELMRRTGMEVQVLGGCCGLAGNFGVTEGHYEVSQAVGEVALLPAVRAAEPDTVVLADGYSCRTQISDLTDRRGVHLAELLASRLSQDWHTRYAEDRD